jgi:predicted Zn finger-like uncharacterized protein
MQIACPTCNATYRVPTNRIPGKGALATCKKCGAKIAVEPGRDGDSIPNVQARAASAPAGYNGGEQRESSPGSAERTASELKLVGEYPELNELAPEKFALGEIFTPNNDGTFKNRKNKFKLKILKAVHGVLSRMLEDGERVRRIAKATAYHPAEIFLGNGYLTTMYNHYAVAATDRRLLFVNITPKISEPTHYFFQMPYSGIKKLGKGLLGTNLILHRVQGGRRVFTGMKRYLAREFLEFIEKRREEAGAPKPVGTILEDLCPSCFVPLEKNLLSCSKCGVSFKEPKKAFCKSLLLPGWGDIYLGHRALGSLELLGSLLAWAVMISLLLAGGPENMIVAVVILLFYNVLDGLLTLHMAKKGYMLA